MVRLLGDRADRATSRSIDGHSISPLNLARLTTRGCFRRWRHATPSLPGVLQLFKCAPVRIQQTPRSPAPVRMACNRLGRLGEWITSRGIQPRIHWSSGPGYGALQGARILTKYPSICSPRVLGRGSGCALHNGCSARPDHTFDPFLGARSHRLVAQAYLLVRDLHVAEDLAQRTLEEAGGLPPPAS